MLPASIWALWGRVGSWLLSLRDGCRCAWGRDGFTLCLVFPKPDGDSGEKGPSDTS